MAHRGQEPGERGRPTKGPARRGAHGPARPSLKGAPARGIPGGVRLVHEDEDLIVVDKPPGLLTAGLPGQEIDSVFRYLKVHVRDQHKRRGTKVWIIHRLDKEASGLLVFAKTDRAYEFLKEEFRSRRAHRLYAAVVEGEMGRDSETAKQRDSETGTTSGSRRVVQQPSGTIQSFLIEDEQGIVRSVAAATSPKARSYDKSGDHAKIAVTHWRALAAGQGRTLLQVRLETGRKNQIRVHMQEAKHPIVGDRRYGAATDPIERVCLHAAELGFAHPATGQTVRYSSPVPRAFTSLVGRDSVVLQEEPAERKETEKPKDGVKGPAKGLDNGAAKGAAALRGGAGNAIAAPAKVDRVEPRAVSESWDHVAEWYAGLIEERKSDHHEQVILPGTVRLLRVEPGMRVLDVACGQGVLTHRVAALGAMAVGIDASPKLIEAARRGSAGKPSAEFLVGDAREIAKLDIGEFDRAACVMALMNIEPMSAVLNGVAARLKQGGMFVGVVLHPAFRAPGQTSWGWDGETRSAERGTRRQNAPTPRSQLTQYRRVDGYLSAGQSPIVMNPGEVARGRPPVTTVTFHRPIQTYINAFAKAGLLVDAMEEWPSLRLSQPGPRAAEENRARREIPMFLALRGVKAGG